MLYGKEFQKFWIEKNKIIDQQQKDYQSQLSNLLIENDKQNYKMA